MAARYSIGQKVRVKQTDDQRASPRDCALDAYAGQVGEISNLYWISPRGEETFYMYIVRIGKGMAEIALHEDEIESYLDGSF